MFPGRPVVPLSWDKEFFCLGVPFSQDKVRSTCPGTKSLSQKNKKTGNVHSKTGKRHSKTGKDVPKQERAFQNRKGRSKTGNHRKK